MEKDNISIVKKLNDPVLNTESNTLKVTHQKNGEEIILWIPKDEANTDYQTVLEWVAEGNTIQEAD